MTAPEGSRRFVTSADDNESLYAYCCIDRPAYHYMHLGYGMHTCLGDQVSRVQVPEIIKRLLTLTGLRAAGPIDFRGGVFPES